MQAGITQEAVTELSIPVRDAVLEGELHSPGKTQALVVFAHGSGSSRHSRRNRRVAEHLQHAGLATLLFDLLTANEEVVDAATAELRFNIALLADRVMPALRAG